MTHPHEIQSRHLPNSILDRYRCINPFVYYHVKWVACHHILTRLLGADGGDVSQIWRVAAEVLY